MEGLYLYLTIVVTVTLAIITILRKKIRTQKVSTIIIIVLCAIVILVGILTLPSTIRNILNENKKNKTTTASHTQVESLSTPSSSISPTLELTSTPKPELTSTPTFSPHTTSTVESSYIPENNESAFYLQTMLALIRIYTFHETSDGGFSEGYSEDGCTYSTPIEITVKGLDEKEGVLWESEAIYIEDGIYRVEIPSECNRLEVKSKHFTYGTSFEYAMESTFYLPHEYYLRNLLFVTVFPYEDSLDNCLSIMNLDYNHCSKNYAVSLDRSGYYREPIDHLRLVKGNYLIIYKDGSKREIEITDSGIFDFSSKD